MSVLPVVVSAILTMLLGMLWYSPHVFGTAWMRMTGISPEAAERGKKRMPLMAFVGLCAAMMIAWVMTYVNTAWGFYDWIGALELGFWTWAGFVAPTMLGTVLWEQKPLKLYFINACFWLVAFLCMAQILVFASTGSWAIFTDTAIPAVGQYAGE